MKQVKCAVSDNSFQLDSPPILTSERMVFSLNFFTASNQAVDFLTHDIIAFTTDLNNKYLKLHKLRVLSSKIAVTFVIFFIRVVRIQEFRGTLAQTLQGIAVHFVIKQRKRTQYAQRTEYSVAKGCCVNLC